MEFNTLEDFQEIIMAKKWYIVHTFSGMEQRAVTAIHERSKALKLEEYIGEIIIPTEGEDISLKTTKKKSRKKIFPGYILMELDLNDETWYLIKQTPNITGFIGNAIKPTPLTEEEVERVKKHLTGVPERILQKISFEEGIPVKIIDGPFLNFNGIIEEVKPDKQKLRVLVTIFGRATPVELNFNQVEKV